MKLNTGCRVIHEERGLAVTEDPETPSQKGSIYDLVHVPTGTSLGEPLFVAFPVLERMKRLLKLPINWETREAADAEGVDPEAKAYVAVICAPERKTLARRRC